MKTPNCFITLIFIVFVSISILAQTHFNTESYYQFLQENQDLPCEELLSRHTPPYDYYKTMSADPMLNQYAFLDSIIRVYNLTQDEIELLKINHFMVTERLSYNCFGEALHDIYGNDFPVMVTTDCILHALHASYDRILKDVEITILEPKLITLLKALKDSYSKLVDQYDKQSELQNGLRDVDLYITIARSLLAGEQLQPHYEETSKVSEVWTAIQSENLVYMPLFTQGERKLDFSQFIVRGHYTDQFWDPNTGESRTLGNYFKAMMWLGRIDFWLTQPPDGCSQEDIRRMNYGALLCNELIDLANCRTDLNEMDNIIRMFVGESDNLTPEELSQIIQEQNIDDVSQLLIEATFDSLQKVLKTSVNAGQRILSNFFIMNPFSTEPDDLPVSFKLMGQRFIIDSYIFSNVVYDRIIYQGAKVWRPMPDPLDILFVLGNENALPLLEEELNTFHYGLQLAALRYLVDAYDKDFWEFSLYNVWLQAIRFLNPPEERTGFPFFMKTAAWQQQKFNSQLASWAQLRHDNLLYAKQSYTGGTVCSFPHSFIEPYPAFYQQIGHFADEAETVFSQFPPGSWYLEEIKDYFPRLKAIMDQLEILAEKEINGITFSVEEEEWLRKMLFQAAGSGAPPFSGWYADLYYNRDDAADIDYVIADVHTQPTDEFGGLVGNILHVGVGKINLGIFLTDAPSDNYQPMAFVGPVMSYYEKITHNFDRLTDERWKEMVEDETVPTRPDWINIYLADKNGVKLPEGRELESVIYSNIPENSPELSDRFDLFQNYPNPFNPETTIRFDLIRKSHITLSIYNVLGQKIITLFDGEKAVGSYRVNWDGKDEMGYSVKSGIYYYQIKTDYFQEVKKMILIR